MTRAILRTTLLALHCGVAACGQPDGVGGGPDDRPDREGGGRLTVEVVGGRTARVESWNVSYCLRQGPAALRGLLVFAMSGSDAAWEVRVTSTTGMPTPGTHPVLGGDRTAYEATLTDKSAGPVAADWQRYRAESGTITFDLTTTARLEGTFQVRATPQWPQSTGPAVEVIGSFAAPRARRCVLPTR